MIKIPTYKEHKKGREIRDRFLYLAALVLPFKPEDVLDADILNLDGIEISAKNFLELSKKKPRIRTDNYKKFLRMKGITEEPKDSSEKFEQEERLAAILIYNSSKALFEYLYETDGVSASFKKPPRIKKENLRKLLLSPMDDLPMALEKIGTIKDDANLQLLAHVFRYEKLSDEEAAYRMLVDLDVLVCPYCNRTYTFTVWKKYKGKKATIKSRPQFDHYLPKSLYPYFAISLFNLIPSCSLCNQAKGDSVEKTLYPYSDEFGERIRFQTRGEKNFDYLLGVEAARHKFEVKIVADDMLDEDLKERLENSKKAFHLEELYNGHKDYIFRLFKTRHIFSDAYIEALIEEFPDLLGSKEDVKELLYLMDLDKEHWGKHSLGKLTHDIDEEITDKSPFK